ncbi:uncharacterized protein TNCV_1535141 [Trichonephila clavipes]|uniref:Mutator-like transposase domain-containing protein n=1 Tax=Trichonephila clavipes TaxID=2585209 RepID=A0A8X6UZN0_TRICX|nr:uncharacterized protein TNCV_1535141 [Trichonephila clavipes]
MPRQQRSSLVNKQKANKRWCNEHYSHETDVFRKDETSISSALPERNMRCQTLEDSCLNDLNCCENSEAPHYVIMDVQFLKGLLKNLLCDVCKSSTVKSLNDVRSQAKSAYQSNSAITDIDVTFDGTWLTRGHSSQIGVGCMIDLLTGFVMDFEIMSKHCIECEHAKSGSSCAMEQEAALKLWQRSEDSGYRYTTLLSDGDAKTYQYLNTKEVYGPEIKIKERRVHKPC